MRPTSVLRRIGLPLAAAACLSGAAAKAEEPRPPAIPAAGATPIAGEAVFKAFHEEAGIQRIMDDFIVRITADPRIQRRFATTNLRRLNLLLVEQICYLTGGPCRYSGDDMKSVHAGLGLHDDDFNALTEDLQLSMDKEGVPFAAQNRLLAKLAPMERLIVTK